MTGDGDDGDTSTRQDVKDATDHYRAAFARSQDALVTVVRDLGGSGVAGIRDWASGFFTNRGRDDG